jgi:O-acetylhomoserine/O-acetylserine sulfhydrylase
VSEDLIRVSVGIEHIDDIIEDFVQAFAKVDADSSNEGNKTVTVNAGKAPATTEV